MSIHMSHEKSTAPIASASMPKAPRNGLHLESTVLADKFEFGFMEGVETQFEEIMVAETEGAGEQATDFSVDAFPLVSPVL